MLGQDGAQALLAFDQRVVLAEAWRGQKRALGSVKSFNSSHAEMPLQPWVHSV
jgi:hypothetical protein